MKYTFLLQKRLILQILFWSCQVKVIYIYNWRVNFDLSYELPCQLSSIQVYSIFDRNLVVTVLLWYFVYGSDSAADLILAILIF
jgi:hypothetical protein